MPPKSAAVIKLMIDEAKFRAACEKVLRLKRRALKRKGIVIDCRERLKREAGRNGAINFGGRPIGKHRNA